MDFNVITIGDYSLDVILNIPDTSAVLNTAWDKREICLAQDKKILADELYTFIGGNACNVAVGLQRLGNKCSYVTFVGTDFTAARFKEEMKNEGIDISYCQKRNGTAGNYSTSLIFQKEKTIIIYSPQNEYDLPNLQPVKMLFISSVGKNYKKIFSQTRDFINQNKVLLAFNPASHQLENSVETYKNILERTCFLFVNKQEAVKILEKDDIGIKDILTELKKLGPKVVVVTEGKKGSYVVSDNQFYHCPIYDIEVVQKTGAGDAFTSGYLHAILEGINEAEALRFGTFNAASVAGAWGPHAGLLSKDSMQRILESQQSIKAVKI
jgi:ribokinase